MKWAEPPIIKIYEALGALADGRVEVSDNTAKVYSSSGNKFYEVSYDPNQEAIMANDNGSFWQGYLGYPAIAFLMSKGILSYDEQAAELLKGVKWKDINQKFKNNFEQTLDFILSNQTEAHKQLLIGLVDKVSQEIKNLDLNLLGPKVSPPEGY